MSRAEGRLGDEAPRSPVFRSSTGAYGVCDKGTKEYSTIQPHVTIHSSLLKMRKQAGKLLQNSEKVGAFDIAGKAVWQFPRMLNWTVQSWAVFRI